MSKSFNKLAVLKELGSIEHRLLHDNTTECVVKRQIVQRHVQNLVCDLGNQPKFSGILERMAAWHTTDLEIIAGCALLRSLIPLTYGAVPAGNVIKVGPITGTKRKTGFETGARLAPHFPPDTPVIIINT